VLLFIFVSFHSLVFLLFSIVVGYCQRGPRATTFISRQLPEFLCPLVAVTFLCVCEPRWPSQYIPSNPRPQAPASIPLTHHFAHCTLPCSVTITAACFAASDRESHWLASQVPTSLDPGSLDRSAGTCALQPLGPRAAGDPGPPALPRSLARLNVPDITLQLPSLGPTGLQASWSRYVPPYCQRPSCDLVSGRCRRNLLEFSFCVFDLVTQGLPGWLCHAVLFLCAHSFVPNTTVCSTLGWVLGTWD